MHHVVQISHQNPDASMPLIMPVLVLPNTPEDVADAQIRANSALDLPWLQAADPHDRIAILCGGGPSIKRHTAEIRDLTRKKGATLFGLNACAGWLVGKGFVVDIQAILDAKKETAALVENWARRHIFASQCHPDTVARVERPTLFHLNNTGIEDLFPPERVAQGGYVLVGGGVSVGITSMVMAYAMGYREMHFFGYDSSNEREATHAYRQDMNQFVPNIDVEWGNKTYNASLPMKQQAEAFPRFARQLQAEDVEINVYGDGLLQAMWREPPANERQKYKLLWADRAYRKVCPGENIAQTFLDVAKPDATVIDFGCGTGRGAKAIHELTGLDVMLVDFADNCRDDEVMHFPFLEWDLTEPCPLSAKFGFCSDVMEHIPINDVATVIKNIMASAETVFFQISTVADLFGETIGQKLHLTVRDHYWWRAMLNEKGLEVQWDEERGFASCFLVKNPLHSGGRAVSG